MNFGILPLTFKNPADYDALEQGTRLELKGVRQLVASGAIEIPVTADGRQIVTLLDVSERQRRELIAGGTLNYVKKSEKK